MPQTDPPTAAAPAGTVRPRLERPRDERVLAGVCAGLARHIGADVTLVRAITVALAFLGGASVLAYLILLLFAPQEGDAQPMIRSGRLDEDDDRAPLIIGALVLGIIVTGAGPLPWGGWDGVGWLFLVAAGAGIVWYASRRERSGAVVDAPTAQMPVVEPFVPPAPSDLGAAPTGPGRPSRRGGGRIVTGIVLLAAGAAGLIGSLSGADPAWQTVVAIGVIVAGAGALVAAPLGGARALLAVGFLTAAVGGFAAAVDIDLDGGWGDRLERPATAQAIPHEYRLGIGNLAVDLRQTRFPHGTTVVRAHLGIGELVVRVPRDATVVARASAGIGEVEALGAREDGGSPDVERTFAGPAERRVIVEAHAGLGHVAIEREGGR